MIEDTLLDNAREAPSIIPMAQAVNWQMFRRRSEAVKRLRHIRLGAGQSLIGGHGRDSIAPYWWVGVKVDDLADWGHVDAVNKRGRHGDGY